MLNLILMKLATYMTLYIFACALRQNNSITTSSCV